MPDSTPELKHLWSHFVLHRHAVMTEALDAATLAAFQAVAAAETRWQLTFNDETGPRSLSRAAFEALTRSRGERIARHMAEAIALGAPAWVHRHLPLAGLAADDPLLPLANWTQDPALAQTARQISGAPPLALTQAALWQLTADHLQTLRVHEPGTAEGAIDALIVLTAGWRVDWGGGIAIQPGPTQSLRLLVPQANQLIWCAADTPWGIGAVLQVAPIVLTLVRLRFQAADKAALIV